jgi:hypothetical protein
MVRTAQQYFWLDDPKVKDMIQDLLLFYSRVYYLKINAFAILGNHYHVSLTMLVPEKIDMADLRQRYELSQTRVQDKKEWKDYKHMKQFKRFTDLSKFMWEVNQRSAQLCNESRGTKGHFWGGRFKSVVVESGSAEFRLAMYIEQNPVRAGLAEKASDYEHSSAGKLRRELDADKKPMGPRIPPINELPEHYRAAAYVDYADWQSLDLKRAADEPRQEPPAWVGLLKKAGMSHESLLGMSPDDLKGAFESKELSNWSIPVYGSKKFVHETMRRAGYKNLPEMKARPDI